MKQSLPAYHDRACKLMQFLPAIAVVLFSFMTIQVSAQGTWTAVTNLAPDQNGGGMLLLSDGSVLCKSFSGGGDGIGNIYNKLTPDGSGSYANGTWSSIAPMNKTRLYYSSQVLKDGRVYVAGGEYGTGGFYGETYNPLTNVWTNNPPLGAFVSDANSEILEDGRVLQALVTGSLRTTKIYDPVTNTYITGPSCIGIHNESSWVKLPDNSILFVDRLSRNSERYIPALNQWVADATLPVDIYDPYGLEQGGAVLLPNGKAMFFGSTGHNAIYTPSGNTSPGVWTAAADFPNAQGTPDAPAAMMVNGKVLCAVSPIPTFSNHFPSPTSYYEYDYLTNTFTRVNAPGGGLTTNAPVYTTDFIDLPNGQVLFGLQGSNRYYVYTPDGSPLAAGKPKIKTAKQISLGTFRLTGTGFNGISEGATYGDDWQMNTNYPLVRLTTGNQVFYARTYNWNSTGVMRGTLPDTVFVTAPQGLPHGFYTAVVVANGIASDPLTFNYQPGVQPIVTSGGQDAKLADMKLAASLTELSVAPNPASTQTTLTYSLPAASRVSIMLMDASGRNIKNLLDDYATQGTHSLHINTSHLTTGMYYIRIITGSETRNLKLAVQ